ncbi:MAG: IS110 family transposase [Gemmatimonadetes bacterium]|nr:IS110 family transposase [Gemmatimonadota bacterium]
MSATTRFTDPTLPDPPALYLALELSNRSWKLAFSTGHGQKPRFRNVPARDLDTLTREIARARTRFGLPDSAPLISCFEAGRDGFWIHRFLQAQPHSFNLVVDSASIEVNRRRRRLKTDRIDARKLLTMLIRYHNGESRVWSVVYVPSPEAEDARHLHRELLTLKSERTRVTNRIKGLLAAQGLSVSSLGRGFLDQLDELRLWDASSLLSQLRQRLEREWLHRCDVSQRIRLIEKLQNQRLEASTHDPALELVRQLMTLKGIGLQSAWLFTFEFFAWRNFQNRREVGALAGFTPTPYQSGDESFDQGISKAGSSILRAMAIQIAWGWLHFQPNSALTLWYQRRFASGGRRMRNIGIVAVARRLLIELWRFSQTGSLPEGAVTMS